MILVKIVLLDPTALVSVSVYPVGKMKEHARPPRHQPSARLVNAEEDSVAPRREFRKGVLRVILRLTVTVRRALQTTTCGLMPV